MNIKFDRDRVGLRYRPTDEHVRVVAARAVDSRGGDVTAARAHLRELVALESAAVANDVRYIADRAQLARDNPALLRAADDVAGGTVPGANPNVRVILERATRLFRDLTSGELCLASEVTEILDVIAGDAGVGPLLWAAASMTRADAATLFTHLLVLESLRDKPGEGAAS